MVQSYKDDPILILPEDEEDDEVLETESTEDHPSCLQCDNYQAPSKLFKCGHDYAVVFSLYGNHYDETLARGCQKFKTLPPLNERYAELARDYKNLEVKYRALENQHSKLRETYFNSIDAIVKRSWWQRLFGVS